MRIRLCHPRSLIKRKKREARYNAMSARNNGHMKYDCQNKENEEKKKDVKGKKVLKARIDSDGEDKEIEEELSEFCFMALEEEEDEGKVDLQQTFENLYKDSIMLARKNKELKEMMETMAKENMELRDKVAIIENDLANYLN